jgi:hypothetical protein
MAFNYSPKIVTDGLVLYLDAANPSSYPGSGTVWKDLSKQNNNGVLVNGPTYNNANGGAIVFDNTDDRVTIPHNNIYNFTTGLSISCWCKTTKIINAYITTKTNDSFYLAISPTGTPATNRMSFFLNGTTGGWLQSNIPAATGNWIHTTATWTGGISTIYINGIFNTSASRPGTPQTGSSVLYVGYRLDANSTFFGSIANFQLHNRALSATEILQNYNATKTRFGL